MIVFLAEFKKTNYLRVQLHFMCYIHHSHKIQFWQCTRNFVRAEGVLYFVWMFPKKMSSSKAFTLMFLLFIFLIKPSNFQFLIAISMPEVLSVCYIPLRG